MLIMGLGFSIFWHIDPRGLVNDILVEEHLCYNSTLNWKDKSVHTFPKGISPKVNVIAWLGFEFTYFDEAV